MESTGRQGKKTLINKMMNKIKSFDKVHVFAGIAVLVVLSCQSIQCNKEREYMTQQREKRTQLVQQVIPYADTNKDGWISPQEEAEIYRAAGTNPGDQLYSIPSNTLEKYLDNVNQN